MLVAGTVLPHGHDLFCPVHVDYQNIVRDDLLGV
jgi:hypothetical protein